MSYVLHIWENPPGKPLPASIDEAVQRVEEMCEIELTAPSPKFMALAERLLKRYPDLSTARPAEGADEGDYHELAWSETIDGDDLDAVWGLGLNTGELFEKARDLVIQEANTLGLCALDEQAGEAYLPSGKVLAVPGQATSQPKSTVLNQPQDNAPTTITVGKKVFQIETYDSPTRGIRQASPRSKEVPPLAFEHLIPLMKEHGYTVNKGKRLFTRDLAEGWCIVKIYTDTDHWPNYVKLRIRIGLYCQPIIDLLNKVENRPSKPREEVLIPQLLVNTDKWMEKIDDIEIHPWNGGGGYIIERYDQIETVLAELTRKFKTVVLPALEDVQTFADLDRHLNPPGDIPTSIFEFSPLGNVAEKIAAAYLLHSPHLETLCEKFAEWGAIGKRWVAYVRNHPLEGGK